MPTNSKTSIDSRYDGAMRESQLLAHIYASASGWPAHVTVPPGDDMAVLRLDEKDAQQALLIGVDQVIEAVHFDRSTATLEQIARKALTRNLSDVAAMAALPFSAVAAAQLPRGMSQAEATQLCDAIHQCGRQYDCPVVGGDIAVHDGPLSLGVTVLAKPAGVEPLLRSGAKPGDVLYVTGALGGSMMTIDGKTHHLDFEPRLAVARKLAGDETTRPSAMIDLSDGLGRDLPRLCDASGVGACLQLDRLPISEACDAQSRQSGQPAWRHAIGDGEDYELLFTGPPNLPETVASVAITAVGSIVDRPSAGASKNAAVEYFDADDNLVPVGEAGWDHHA